MKTSELLANIEALKQGVVQHQTRTEVLGEDLLRLNKYPSDNDLTLHDELFDALTEVEELINPVAIHGLALPSPSVTDIPVGEIVNVLKDIYKGRVNELLQEVLNNAEIEVSIQDQKDPKNNKKKEMDITIKLTATAIDRYAGLISMALGTKDLSKDEKKLAENAYSSLETSHQRLQKLLIRRGLLAEVNGLALKIQTYDIQSRSERCLDFFSMSNTSKFTRALINVFKDLSVQALTADEMAGALYLIKMQCVAISNKHRREEISKDIAGLLARYNYPDLRENACELSREFSKRADQLAISWPSPLHLDHPKAEMDCQQA